MLIKFSNELKMLEVEKVYFKEISKIFSIKISEKLELDYKSIS